MKTEQEKSVELLKGESAHRKGGYQFRWTDSDGKRHCIYAKTLKELRVKEKEVERDFSDNIKPEARFVTINEMYERWKQVKRGLKDNTFQNYQYMYTQFVAPNFGKQRISTLVKTDVKRFYNYLLEDRGLAIATVDGIHNVIHQILDMAVDDWYIRRNPAEHAMKEVKQVFSMRSDKRKALTKQQQELFLNYLKETPLNQKWYPVFSVMAMTGMRVGETVGLRWCDVDLDEGFIDINHTLVFYNHETNGYYCNAHTPKTKASIRQIPMLNAVKEAFLMEKQYQEANGIHCRATVDGYTDFIFLNRYGDPQHQGTLNKVLRRIIRDCNDEILTKGEDKSVLLPYFSCHILRHSFATRMCEAGVNIKVIQDVLGHSDVSTTLNIYADATKDFKRKSFEGFEGFFR